MFNRVNNTCPNCGSTALKNRIMPSGDEFDKGWLIVEAECLDCYLSRKSLVRMTVIHELCRVGAKRRSVVRRAFRSKLRMRPAAWKRLVPSSRVRFYTPEMKGRLFQAANCLFAIDEIVKEQSIGSHDWLKTAQDGRQIIRASLPENRALSSVILVGSEPGFGLSRFLALSDVLDEQLEGSLKWCLLPYHFYSLDQLFTYDGVES
jgi:hypothetical protein